MSRWAGQVRKTLLSLIRPQSDEGTDISPRSTVETIDKILNSFEKKVEEEADSSLKLLFTGVITNFRARLNDELERIAEVENKREVKRKKKKNMEEILTIKDIQAALDRLAKDIARDEDHYETVSQKVLLTKTAITMSTEAWLACLNEGEDIRAPEHEMRQPEFYTQVQQSTTNTSTQRVERPEKKKIEDLVMKARWLSILAWTTADQNWRDEQPVPFDPDNTIWKRGRHLGDGFSGSVSVAAVLGNEPRDDQKAIRVLVVKRISLEGESKRRAPLEAHCRALYRAGKHPHVVSVLAHGTWRNEYRIFMEYVSGGSLSAMIRHLKFITEVEATAIVRQIGNGLQHLHTLGFVHRDLKGSNVLVTLAGCVKICDLDTAKDPSREEHGKQSTFGTPLWMAPESANGRFSPRSDVWSLGCIVVELLTGRNPWQFFHPVEPDDITVKLKAMDSEDQVRGPPLPGPRRLSDRGRTLLQTMVFVRLESRAGVAALLKHPWLAQAAAVDEGSTPSEAPEEEDINEIVGELEDIDADEPSEEDQQRNVEGSSIIAIP